MVNAASGAVEHPSQPTEINPNALAPELAANVDGLFDTLATPAIAERIAGNQALQALHTQTVNHLQHVRFDYTIEPESPDYTHDYVLPGAYTRRPSQIAIAKGDEFLNILQPDQTEPLPYEAVDEAREAELNAAQKAVTREIIQDPLKAYQDFHDRLQQAGEQASFPEFAPTVELLRARVLSSPAVAAICTGDPSMEKFRRLTLGHLDNIIDNAETPFPYTNTVLAIERATEFFDVVCRAEMGEDAPELYHSGRYEYYLHYLLAQKEHIIFPTGSALSATDLIKVRGVPIGFVGVNTTVERVDGFKQTPYEFFHHDVNHSRRMFQFLSEAAERHEQSVPEFAADSNTFVHNELLPIFIPTEQDSEAERNHKIATRMLLFEILHEDALPANPNMMAEAILRPPMLRTPFERIEDDTVVYFMEPGATTLAYVFRKLAHTFYDTPDQRFAALGDDAARSRWEIVKAAVNVYRTISDDPITDEALVRNLEQLVATDEGFPEAFFNEVLDDMKERADTTRDFTFLVSKPETAAASLARIKALGKRVHTLFGFSDLGYRDEAAMLGAVRANLEQFDPEQTIVAIGATPGGIGGAYRTAKDLGFATLGIVSSKSIAHGGNYSDAVDEVVIVKDTEWGGYLPDQPDIITPTTEVFVEASDSIAAFGGGNITAVSLAEAVQRGVPVTFEPFKLQPADNNPTLDSYGPAYEAWQRINNARL